MTRFCRYILTHGAKVFLLASLLVLSEIEASIEPLQCRDEHGQAVDWFVAYKLPKHSAIQPKVKPFLDEGLAYVFMSSANPNTGWVMGDVSIGDVASAPGRTLAPLYQNQHKKSFKKNHHREFLYFKDQHEEYLYYKHKHEEPLFKDDEQVTYIVYEYEMSLHRNSVDIIHFLAILLLTCIKNFLLNISLFIVGLYIL